MTDRIVYLMRGLPACEKSYAARKAAGADGVICETDEDFYTQVGDDPTRYDYDADLLPAARRWNFDRFKQAVDAGASPVVVDRGNGRNAETLEYARYALGHGYRVELKEPDRHGGWRSAPCSNTKKARDRLSTSGRIASLK